ncbi:MAG: hypothetical protein MUF49_29965 [Oculatellaceae cyanobacterium Prado106]|nr:hypothetical protein [Oculatellaceae cyanobacterium Prado106]
MLRCLVTLLWVGLVLLGFGAVPMGCAVRPPQVAIASAEQEGAIAPLAKPELALQILTKIGTVAQYDRYLSNSVDIALPLGSPHAARIAGWLQQSMAQRAGWKQVEQIYVDRLITDFTETELQEFLELAQHPLLQKLLRSEMQAYADSASKRRQHLQQFWEDYNSGAIVPPPEILQVP